MQGDIQDITNRLVKYLGILRDLDRKIYSCADLTPENHNNLKNVGSCHCIEQNLCMIIAHSSITVIIL